jgi:SEC-C motif-containing protein
MCPCGSGKKLEECCLPIIEQKTLAKTAEELMRSRYTAFTLANVDYLKNTLAPESREDFDEASTRTWAKNAKWKGLKIISTKKGQESDKRGTVEFMATYETDGEGIEHHEVAEFRKTAAGQWYFVDGDSHTHKEGEGHAHHHHTVQTVVRDAPKIGRNDPCSCGSGKKFKKCCGSEG